MRSFPVVAGALALAAATTQSQAQAAHAPAVAVPSPRVAVLRALTEPDSARAVLGLSTTSGSERDTLGLLIVSIVSASPAEKAGLEEGNRIASINGVNLRVSSAEAGDREMRGLMQRRLEREMRKVKPGDVVHLRVHADGQTKMVDVKTASAADVYANTGPESLFLGDGAFGGKKFRYAPAAPRVPALPKAYVLPSIPPGACSCPRMEDEWKTSMERSLRDAQRRMRDNENRARAAVLTIRDRGPRSIRRGSTVTVSGSGDSYTLRMPGLLLAPVNGDLASYLGSGSENGLLVLDAAPWTSLHAGDVLLQINGKKVRTDDHSSISLDSRVTNKAEIIRKGKRMTVEMGTAH
ncbi:MAG TPA: PDZ domain-containing protein [Gemmatimonadaceae bacterium]|nr:PDZ domain-containing protein [Gemmatimonadaceae bacterium]